MINPWLRIPASDYEGHMSSPHVGQQQFLAQTFQESLNVHDSSSVALLGCATGNGLEYVNRDTTQRVTANSAHRFTEDVPMVIRECNVSDIRFIGLHHNTVRGAAGGAILTAELLKVKGYLNSQANK